MGVSGVWSLLRHGTVPPVVVARSLLVVMRRGSLSAAEELTGHKFETIGRWLRAAAQQVEVVTEVLVRDLHLTEVAVGAFWSLVNKCADAGEGPGTEAGVGPRSGCLSIDLSTRFVVAWASGGSEADSAPEVVRVTRRRTRGQGGILWVLWDRLNALTRKTYGRGTRW